MPLQPLPGKASFGSFELDPAAGELRKRGRKIRVPEQAIQILTMLVERPGEIIAREEIRGRLWPNGTLVEFEHSINEAIKKLRLALEDSAAEPRYIETVKRRGYRIIVPVQYAPPPPDLESVQPSEMPGGGLTGRRISHYR